MSGSQKDAGMTRGIAAEYGLICAWFMVSLIVIGVLNLVSAPMRDRQIVRSVNSVLERSDNKTRLLSSTSKWGVEGRASLAGARFSLEKSAGMASVFTVTGGGGFAVCVALINEAGMVEAVLPLGPGSTAALERLPGGLVRAYTTRIEEAERMIRSREKKK